MCGCEIEIFSGSSLQEMQWLIHFCISHLFSTLPWWPCIGGCAALGVGEKEKTDTCLRPAEATSSMEHVTWPLSFRVWWLYQHYTAHSWIKNGNSILCVSFCLVSLPNIYVRGYACLLTRKITPGDRVPLICPHLLELLAARFLPQNDHAFLLPGTHAQLLKCI